LDGRAQQAYPGAWRRFELNELMETAAIDVGTGVVQVYPALARGAEGVSVRFEWSRAEAERRSQHGWASLARIVLERPARDLAKKVASDVALLLAASPYLRGEALIDALLQRVFWRACFKDAALPRTRAAFDAAVESGRAQLHPVCDAITTAAAGWFAAARAVRRLLEDPRARSHAALAEATQAHLKRLLVGALSTESYTSISDISENWDRQLLRYIKAEQRRWQRLFERGGEPPQIGAQLSDWTVRAQSLDAQVAAEMRWLPQLAEFHAWIEEYRISLYAQELRTLVPISAARLAARAADIEAWVLR
jgi:ATP-dependent helicase HrpA